MSLTQHSSARGTRAIHLAVLVAMLPAIGLTGCGPAQLLDNPAGWPETLAGRRLYHTPNAYIYASSDAAAGEIDRQYQQIADDFHRQTGAEARGKPLLIVIDSDDPPLFEKVEDFYAIAVRQDPNASRDYTGVNIRLAESAEEYEAMIAEAGLRGDDLLAMMPLPLEKSDLADTLGMPPEAAREPAWAMAVPTRAATGWYGGKMAQIVFNRQNLVVRVLVFPFMPIIQSVSSDVAMAMVRARQFEAALAQRTEWCPEVLREHLAIYRRSGLQRALGILAPMMMKDDAGAPAESPAEDETPIEITPEAGGDDEAM